MTYKVELPFLVLASFGSKVYHKLSNRKFNNNWTTCLEQPQCSCRLMSKVPVITILYIISDNRGPVPKALRIRSKIRWLSLRKRVEGHNPLLLQVLHSLKEGV